MIDQTFDKIDFKEDGLPKEEYDTCTFISCDFYGTDLSGCSFLDCEFVGCNLSMAKLLKTSIQDTTFKNCKMLGLHFDQCNPFNLSFRFEGCTLNYASFFKTKLKGIRFRDCQLQEADFVECDLSGAVFDNCDLLQAVFDRTNLEKADLRTAVHYSIDPENNRIRKAKFSFIGLAGLLDKYDIVIDNGN